MTKFTDYALDKNAVEFQKEFQRVVSDKVNNTLDALRVHVASTMFTEPSEVSEEIEEVDEAKETRAEFRLATPDIIAKNNARLAKKKADAAKRLRKKEKYDGGVK